MNFNKTFLDQTTKEKLRWILITIDLITKEMENGKWNEIYSIYSTVFINMHIPLFSKYELNELFELMLFSKYKLYGLFEILSIFTICESMINFFIVLPQ